jgi:hypothetical protein
MAPAPLSQHEAVSGQDPGAASAVVTKIIELLSLESDFAQRTINCLSEKAREHWTQNNPWMALWKEHSLQYFDIDQADKILDAWMPESTQGQNLFIVQSYCAVLVEWVLDSLLKETKNRKPVYSASLFGWLECTPMHAPIELDALLSKYPWKEEESASSRINQFSDFLARLYQEIMPPELRHLLGEYYTPSWLIDYSIEHAQKELDVDKGKLLVTDPSVGSGGFLAHYAAVLACQGRSIHVKLCGFDINPIAVLFCTGNLTLAKEVLRDSPVKIEFDVHLSDSVVDPIVNHDMPLLYSENDYCALVLGKQIKNNDTSAEAAEEIMKDLSLTSKDLDIFHASLMRYIDDLFYATKRLDSDVIVGNPPWISWDGLSTHYRDKVAPQWSASSLFTSKGWNAKVAAGKTDFSSLFVYRSAERYAAANGIMVFVLPISLFQSRLSGQGFRQFKTSTGRSFPLACLDDFSKVKVFPDAVNRTSVGVFRVDRKSAYPIPYISWTRSRKGETSSDETAGGPIKPTDNTSPIVKYDKGSSSINLCVGKSDYRARGGVNTGGANTILQLNLLADKGEFVTIQNTGKSRRSSSEIVTAEVESEVVYPLLCGTDMKRWKARPSKSILLMYDPRQPKKAIQESIVRSSYPKAYSFLCQFKESLATRKEYHRWGCSGPFYEVYRIGPYTFSPFKVAWQHTGYKNSLNISVINDADKKVTIPDQKAIIIPCDCLQEAHYICAFMGSSVVASILNKYLGTDASTHIMDYISLRTYNPLDDRHLALSSLSFKAHELAAINQKTEAIEEEIDAIVKNMLT